MIDRARRIAYAAAVAFGAMVAASCGVRKGGGGSTTTPQPPPPAPPPHAIAALHNDSPFAPAFAKLIETQKLDSAQLGDPLQCAGCHPDVVSQWDPSAHHFSSFTNRFYAASVDLTRKDKGNVASRWCAGCHDPSLLLNDNIDKAISKEDPRAGDGVSCMLCHSITKPTRLGGGGWTLDWRGFVEPNVKDAASIAKHKEQMKPAVMNDGEFCGSCHKVSIHEDVNGKKWLRGQNDFDGWEQGPYALGGEKTATAIYAPDVEAQTCQSCHMPPEGASEHELAAKSDASGKKVVRSHRFLAANTAIAALAHDQGTVDAQAQMLKDAVRVDVIAVRTPGAPGASTPIESASVAAGESIALDVVVENTRVGHRFPTGTADSNEIWMELEVRDAKGVVVAQSGALDAKDRRDPEAHTFGVLQLDGDGKPATHREAHRFVAAGWDTTIAPRDAKVIRDAFEVPKTAALPLSVEARVLYRKFTPDYLAFACASTAASLPPLKSCPKLPVVEVAKDEAVVGASHESAVPKWKRLDAYARGLLQALQEQVGDARPVLDEVIALAPDRAEGWIDLARLYIRQGRTQDAMSALDRAAAIDPKTPVVPFLRGVAHYEVYKLGDAVDPLRLAIEGAPKSTMAYELLSEGLELEGLDLEAITVAQKGLLVDPEDAQLHHLEALGFDKLGMKDDADVARDEYLRYRKDDDTPKLRSLCKKNIPGCAREADPLHVHWME